MKPAWSRLKSWRFSAVALAAALACRTSLAATTDFQNCKISTTPTAIPATYNQMSGSPLLQQVTVNIVCDRNNVDNVMAFPLTLGVANGTNYSGGQRVKSGTSYLNYQLLQSDGVTSWDSTSRISVPITWNGQGKQSGTGSATFWFKMPAWQTQAVVGGVYTDSAVVTVYWQSKSDSLTNIQTSTGQTVAPSVTIASSCALSSTPQDLTFTYTSFQTSAASASTQFGVRCTNGLPYTMALDATSGSLLGLNYSLATSPTGQQTGSGVAQTVTISGQIAASQSGTCASASCTASQARTFTISY